MPFTLALPEWLPAWVPVVVLVLLLLWFLVFLFVPFSVLGVKGRLESLELRLDEIHAELRNLSARIPPPVQARRREATVFDESYAMPPGVPPIPPEPVAVPLRPPIPPAAEDRFDMPRITRPRAPVERRGETRQEPRLDWPK
jgi:hypothetical protein